MKALKLSSYPLVLLIFTLFPLSAYAITDVGIGVTSAGIVNAFPAGTWYKAYVSTTESCAQQYEGALALPAAANYTLFSCLADLMNCAGTSQITINPPNNTNTPQAFYVLYSPTTADAPHNTCSDSDITGEARLNYDGTNITSSGLNLLDTRTRIVSVTPAASSTIATSTSATFGGTVYINSSDFVTGTFIEQKYVYQANALIVAANTQAQFTTLDFPISSAGLTNFSTTSPALRSGRYTMVTSIRNPSLLDSALSFVGFTQFGNFGLITATTTTFTAGALSPYDLLTDSMVNNINTYLASSTISLASCTNWTQLNLVDCMNLVFVPQWAPIKDAVDNFRNGFLTYWPWGYITRFAVIMSGSATTTLPAFQVNMNNVLPPGTVDGNYTLDMNDMLAGGSAALDAIPARGGTANDRDILEPILRTFLALLVVIMIVRDLTKIGTHHNSAAARGHV